MSENESSVCSHEFLHPKMHRSLNICKSFKFHGMSVFKTRPTLICSFKDFIEIYDLQFWHINIDPVTKFTEEGWGDLCDASDTNLQRIGIEVRSVTGEIVERVEVIIGE